MSGGWGSSFTVIDQDSSQSQWNRWCKAWEFKIWNHFRTAFDNKLEHYVTKTFDAYVAWRLVIFNDKMQSSEVSIVSPHMYIFSLVIDSCNLSSLAMFVNKKWIAAIWFAWSRVLFGSSRPVSGFRVNLCPDSGFRVNLCRGHFALNLWHQRIRMWRTLNWFWFFDFFALKMFGWTMTSSASSVSLQEELPDPAEPSPAKSPADDSASIQQRLIAAMEEAAWTFWIGMNLKLINLNLRVSSYDPTWYQVTSKENLGSWIASRYNADERSQRGFAKAPSLLILCISNLSVITTFLCIHSLSDESRSLATTV